MRMWMALTQVACPLCASQHVVRFGINRQKKQRYQYRNTECSKDPFILVYAHKGYLPETKRAIVELTLNGSGIRDISRELGISVNTVLTELKKEPRRTTTSVAAYCKAQRLQSNACSVSNSQAYTPTKCKD